MARIRRSQRSGRSNSATNAGQHKRQNRGGNLLILIEHCTSNNLRNVSLLDQLTAANVICKHHNNWTSFVTLMLHAAARSHTQHVIPTLRLSLYTFKSRLKLLFTIQISLPLIAIVSIVLILSLTYDAFLLSTCTPYILHIASVHVCRRH